MPELVYKIRRKTDGLFSTGGCNPSFTKAGKTWSSKMTLHNHLTLIEDGGSWAREQKIKDLQMKKTYGDCEVVEFKYTQYQGNTFPVFEYNQARKTKKKS